MNSAGWLKIILLSLAFTNSVTLPIGFPLKIYEAVGMLAITQLLLGGGWRLGEYRRIPFWWLIFLFGSMVATAWGMHELGQRDLQILEWANGRYLPLINTLFHSFYLLFDIGLLVLTLHVLNTGGLSLADFCRWWTYGALASVLYGILLNMVLAVGLPAALLLRFSEVNFMNVFGLPVARTGPFEEGNYFGLYLLASVVIALYAGRRWPGHLWRRAVPLLLVGVVMTASPAALLGAAVAVFVAIVTGKVSSTVRTSAVVAGAAIMAVLVASGLFQTLVLDKFSLLLQGGVTDTRNVSLVQRLNESYHAWLMFKDFPWGVGIGNYGYFFGYYPDLYPWLLTDWQNFKPIPNNVYLEVLAEQGLAMLLLFLFILGSMARRLFRTREYLVLAGLLLVCVYFMAFPTYRLSLIWVFFAFVTFLGRDAHQSESRSS